MEVQRRLFTVDEFHEMARAGIFSEHDRVELIQGEIVEMTPIGSRHIACVNPPVRKIRMGVEEHGLPASRHL